MVRLLIGVAAAFVVVVLWRYTRRRKPRPVQRTGDTDIFQMMERLGIPAESGRGGTHQAGTAKTRLFQHVRAIEAGRWEEAVEGLSETIDFLSRQADARWGDILGVAHRLRARAHEGAGRRAEALADYERALAFQPDDPAAREGQARLGP